MKFRDMRQASWPHPLAPRWDSYGTERMYPPVSGEWHETWSEHPPRPDRQRASGRDPDRGPRPSRFGPYGWAGAGLDARPSHAGRGPRGYVRSDDRIREDVCDLLADDPRIDASDMEVTVSGGEVRLAGTVASRAERRRAEDRAHDVRGVADVRNDLRVRGSAI